MKSHTLRGWAFDSILQQRASVGACVIVSVNGGVSSQNEIRRIQWPILWTESGPVHACHVVELVRRGELGEALSGNRRSKQTEARPSVLLGDRKRAISRRNQTARIGAASAGIVIDPACPLAFLTGRHRCSSPRWTVPELQAHASSTDHTDGSDDLQRTIKESLVSIRENFAVRNNGLLSDTLHPTSIDSMSR